MTHLISLRRWAVIAGVVSLLLGCATSPSEMRAGTSASRVAEFTVPGRLTDVVRCYVSELDERMPNFTVIVRDKGTRTVEVQQRSHDELINLHDVVDVGNSVQIKLYVFSRDFTPGYTIEAARAAASACGRVAS